MFRSNYGGMMWLYCAVLVADDDDDDASDSMMPFMPYKITAEIFHSYIALKWNVFLS